MWTVHIRGPAQFEAHLISSQVNDACSISQCFIFSQFLCEQAIWWSHPPLLTHHYPVCWTNTFVTALFFLTPNNHKLTDSGEAQLSLVFLVDTFKVFPYGISGVINSLFLMILEYTVYSVCFCCFCGQQLSCNSDAFWLIAVLLHGLYSVILIKPTLRRAAGSLCNLCPHSKIVQLNKMNNIASPKGSVPPNYKKTCFLLLLVIFKHADSWDFEKSF